MSSLDRSLTVPAGPYDLLEAVRAITDVAWITKRVDGAALERLADLLRLRLSCSPENRGGAGAFLTRTGAEHAFLAQEAEELAREAAGLTDPTGGAASDREAGLARVLRCVSRIEAVLELGVLSGEARLPTAEPGGEGSGAPLPGGSGPHAPADVDAMPAAVQDSFIRARQWGILSTVGGGQPYAVPVAYGYDGESIYLASGPGRKADNLDRCPAVCLTIPDIEDADHWRCVVVTGEAHRIRDLAGRIAALAALGRHVSPETARRELSRLAQTRFFRVRPQQITGRARGVTAPAPAGEQRETA